MAADDIELLQRSLDYAGSSPEVYLVVSDIPNIVDVLRVSLASQISLIEELPVHDSHTVSHKLSQRGRISTPERELYAVDLRNRDDVTEEERSKVAAYSLNMGRNSFIGGSVVPRDSNLAVVVVLGEDDHPWLNRYAKDFVSMRSGCFEINQADLPQAAEMTREQAFGARPIKPEECKA